ncbi:P-loop containing nucleoside triphosphate hydrolase protein [Calycina marina]|uniref:P-loop containing nucleoside triphosphate hydrolase protein n=1 Tax=Calycina marina TaxID=1763456 RepID=A0A9P8CJ28_9HELO|nr:P-loop containing nucleoside triphosphate hydrolase protein [Calycina marina]
MRRIPSTLAGTAALKASKPSNTRSKRLRLDSSKESAAPTPLAVVRIRHEAGGAFYRNHPRAATENNPKLFPNLTFIVPSSVKPPKNQEHWAIIGPSSSGKTTFLQILRGQHVSLPAKARTYPYLESPTVTLKDPGMRVPSRAIQYVGFDGEKGLGEQAPRSAYLSSRYESRREETDFSVLDYLKGNTELNPLQDIGANKVDEKGLKLVIHDLRLGDLINMPVSNLSNGQTRRARIAKALLSNPELLLLDEPLMGLDPPTLLSLSPMLHKLAQNLSPRLLLTLRPQDPIPEWITHIMYLKNCAPVHAGRKENVLQKLAAQAEAIKQGILPPESALPDTHELGRSLTCHGIYEPKKRTVTETDLVYFVKKMVPKQIEFKGLQSEKSRAKTGSRKLEIASQATALSRDGYPLHDEEPVEVGEPLVEMEGAHIKYGEKSVLGKWTQEVDGVAKQGLWWTIRRGERWGIFGPNGSGKTTLLSLICSDHPQTYSLPIRLFGRSRLPEPGYPGVSIFDIQARIGHSSPEIHNHITKSLTLRKVIANAWADTFKGVPKLDDIANARIDACLRWFEDELRLFKSVDGEKSGSTAWADEVLFGGLPFSAQRVALFLRAIVKSPDLIILDEAFSGMDNFVRDRCLLFLAHGENKCFNSLRQIISSKIAKNGEVRVSGLSKEQALVCISHVREEIPGSVRKWICLPEAVTGKPPRVGTLDGPIEGCYKRWGEIWDM